MINENISSSANVFASMFATRFVALMFIVSIPEMEADEGWEVVLKRIMEVQPPNLTSNLSIIFLNVVIRHLPSSGDKEILACVILHEIFIIRN